MNYKTTKPSISLSALRNNIEKCHDLGVIIHPEYCAGQQIVLTDTVQHTIELINVFETDCLNDILQTYGFIANTVQKAFFYTPEKIKIMVCPSTAILFNIAMDSLKHIPIRSYMNVFEKDRSPDFDINDAIAIKFKTALNSVNLWEQYCNGFSSWNDDTNATNKLHYENHLFDSSNYASCLLNQIDRHIKTLQSWDK